MGKTKLISGLRKCDFSHDGAMNWDGFYEGLEGGATCIHGFGIDER